MAGIILSAVILTWVLAITPGDREPASVILFLQKYVTFHFSAQHRGLRVLGVVNTMQPDITLSKGGFEATGGSHT